MRQHQEIAQSRGPRHSSLSTHTGQLQVERVEKCWQAKKKKSQALHSRPSILAEGRADRTQLGTQLIGISLKDWCSGEWGTGHVTRFQARQSGSEFYFIVAVRMSFHEMNIEREFISRELWKIRMEHLIIQWLQS